MDTKFTQEQKNGVIAVLTERCVGETCITRPELFDAVRSLFAEDYTDVQFGATFSDSLKDGEFPGFVSRRGRTGGICRAGVFDAKDAARKEKVNSNQTTIEVNDKTFVARGKANVFQKYIVDVLGGIEDNEGTIKVNDKTFTCDEVLFVKYLNVMVEVEELQE